MDSKGVGAPPIRKFEFKRKAVTASQADWVKVDYSQLQTLPPAMITPAIDGVDLIAWASGNPSIIESNLLKHGAILFRNFDLASSTRFEELIRATSGELIEYQDQATPRSQVSGHIYSSTDYPPEHHIELHNESSYAFVWPARIFFFCVTLAREGGETPIADSRKVFERISPQVRERFISKKIMYVRNYGDVFGLPWQTVFQTSDMNVAFEYCRKNRIEVIRKGEGSFKTCQVREAVAKHPKTGEMVWFNQATSFHITTLDPVVRQALLEQVSEADVPKNAYYGDGSPIEESVLDEIREAYSQETIAFPWRNGDVLMLDNMLMSHGRRPFAGPRKVIVGMAGPLNWDMI